MDCNARGLCEPEAPPSPEGPKTRGRGGGEMVRATRTSRNGRSYKTQVLPPNRKKSSAGRPTFVCWIARRSTGFCLVSRQAFERLFYLRQ